MKRQFTFRYLIFITIFCFSSSVFALVLPLPKNGDDMTGQNFVIQVNDNETIETVAQRYDVSVLELLEANPGITPPNLSAGTRLVISHLFILPKPFKGIAINLPELRLYYFPPGKNVVMTYPLGIGRIGWDTPITQTKVVTKKKNPDWRPTPAVRQYMLETFNEDLPDVVEAGPKNPLGPRAMFLGVPGYLIHGNNAPESIGKRVSSGCIRMYNQDVVELFDKVNVGTLVTIINDPTKLGTLNGQLYLEVQRPLSDDENDAEHGVQGAMSSINSWLADHNAHVDWQAVQNVGEKETGIPYPVGNVTG